MKLVAKPAYVRFRGVERGRPVTVMLLTWLCNTCLFICVRNGSAQEPILGSTGVHDPSTMIKSGSRYYVFSTGTGIASKSSADRVNWSTGPSVFATPPAWTGAAVPGFTDNFWAPDVIFHNGQYYLYYSVSTFGSQVSAIGLATNPTLDPANPGYLWTDQGPVIQSTAGSTYNTIDPGVMVAADGRMWMAFGSFWTGIKMIELDPATGKRISPTSTVYSLATHNPSTAIEAACLIQRSNYYYLFVNWDTCCSGLDSTYNIRIGRSTNVTGPYLDRNGVSMTANAGTLFLESSGRYIGPGHAGVMVEGETNWFTWHYYDGNNNGSARLGLSRLSWDTNGWPHVTNNWNAFYTFEADAREHLGLFNGLLRNGAAVTNEPGRAGVLNLDGATQFVTLPLSVANASTFAVWAKWNGGATWQRLLDFGDGTNNYFFLTPRASNGRMRFAITSSGAGGERIIDAPTAFPTGSWAHVAVTLDGARGLMYLNGNLVASNVNITLRPWQVQARSNYLGESQFGADPAFGGQLDSLRIYGRTLSGNEIQGLSRAHPALAHRYSFTADAADSIGASDGRLRGNAVITNQSVVLDGSTGTYVNLPGTSSSPAPGLVTRCAAVTLEFWATFGANGSWARVFDFGNTNGANGQQFLFFSPRTGLDSHRLGISTSAGTSDLDSPGTLEGQTVHVVCIMDPAAGYSALYTNGMLDRALTGSLPALSGVSTAFAWLGRSLFSADAWLNGSIDEFRIYDGRLTPAEIAANAAAGPDALAIPVSLTASNSPAGIVLTWPAYAAGFVLETSPAMAGGTWSAVGSTPALSANTWKLTVPATDAEQYFRLKR
jgi:glycosyl hydrolase family 43/concanavalin A-like lectin/glucanase superfamily protein